MNRDIIAFTKYKFNVYGKKDIRSGRDSAVVGIVGKSKSLDFPTMLIFWSLVRNSVVLAVYLLFSVACFLTVHEHYYKAHNDLSYDERTRLNYDHPDSFDTDLMIGDIAKLSNGEEADIPVYDFSIHNRTDSTTHVFPKNVIIVEGILILANKELRDLMDIMVFVDTDADERLLRRIKRDVNERARTIDSIINQYQQTVKPMHEQFVEPSKKYADIIIPRGGENSTGITILTEHIKHKLAG